MWWNVVYKVSHLYVPVVLWIHKAAGEITDIAVIEERTQTALCGHILLSSVSNFIVLCSQDKPAVRSVPLPYDGLCCLM